MKCRLLILLATLTGLLLATNAMAHNPGQVLVYRTPQLSGGITVWDNSYGQSGYAGNINLGFGYAPATYYGHVHAPSCGHQFAYPYVNGYPVGFTNGHGGAHHGNTHGRHHGRGRYKGHR
jgi:hypothetical protein